MQSINNVNPLLSDAKVYLFFVVYGIVIIAGVFFFARWYLKKLYVNYISELKLQLKDLKEN